MVLIIAFRLRPDGLRLSKKQSTIPRIVSRELITGTAPDWHCTKMYIRLGGIKAQPQLGLACAQYLYRRKSLSTVARGRDYEISCKNYLEEHLAMQLVVSGGAGDQGVDLRGFWLDEKHHNIIVQCKHYSKKVGPATIREMEGTASFYASPTAPPVISAICAKSGFSTASWKRALASHTPLLLLHLDVYPGSSTSSGDDAQILPSLRCHGLWMNLAFQHSLDRHPSMKKRMSMLIK